MRRYLPFIIVIVVGCTAVGSSLWLYKSKRQSYSKATSGQVAMNPQLKEGQHIIGPADARVRLDEFADFQCPACRATSDVLQNIAKSYGSRIRIGFLEFPLPMHRHGRDAALAAEAAGKQGRFWEMHDLLYFNQNAWSDLPDIRQIFDSYAETLHLDRARFEHDCRSAEVASRVDAEHSLGEARGVQKTPTIFLNDQLVSPPFTEQRLRESIDKALANLTKT